MGGGGGEGEGGGGEGEGGGGDGEGGGGMMTGGSGGIAAWKPPTKSAAERGRNSKLL